MRDFLNAMFFNKPKAIDNGVPVFKITESPAVKSDFEVTELTYEEYVEFSSPERRHVSRPVSYDRRKPTGASRSES